MKTLQSVLSKRPRECKFKIVMSANSTTEVWVDIPTLISGNDAWHIVGLEYVFESISRTLPLLVIPAANAAAEIQLHRNVDNVIHLNSYDDDVIARHVLTWDIDGSIPVEYPIHVDLDEVTTQPKLRALFGTSADISNISDPGVQLAGKIQYHKVSGPNVGHTKLGRLTEF